jgi:hypothetical protein
MRCYNVLVSAASVRISHVFSHGYFKGQSIEIVFTPRLPRAAILTKNIYWDVWFGVAHGSDISLPPPLYIYDVD